MATAQETTTRGRRVELQGEVVANKMQKTISVLVYRNVRHAKYGKYVKKSNKKNFVRDFINPSGKDVPLLSEVFYANFFKINKMENKEIDIDKIPKMNYTLIFFNK